MAGDGRMQGREEAPGRFPGEPGGEPPGQEFPGEPAGELPGESGMTELELENKRLREENERLKEYRAGLAPKERMYDHIPLTLKQMDIIIGCLLALLAVVVVLGLINR